MVRNYGRSQEGKCVPCATEYQKYLEQCKGRVIHLEIGGYKEQTEREYKKLEEVAPKAPKRDFFNSGISIKLEKIMVNYYLKKLKEGVTGIISDTIELNFEDKALSLNKDYFIKQDLSPEDQSLYFSFRFEKKLQTNKLKVKYLKPNILLENVAIEDPNNYSKFFKLFFSRRD